MSEQERQTGVTDGAGELRPPAYRIRLPRFIAEEEIGLGDALKRVTSVVGIRPCGGCLRRAEAMNRWLALGPWIR